MRWLGLLGGRAALEGDVVVVSPHIDDAALSLGAAISHATRRGARVTILTVLAGDPGSTTPAGEWDRRSGFTTAGEAANARRAEDATACGHLGARPVWLPYFDHQYERGASDDEVRAAVVEAVGASLALLPGFPLMHEDHRWLRVLLDGAFPAERHGLYAEQPYAAFWTEQPGAEGSPSPELVPPPARWGRLRAGLVDQRRKLAAYRAYASQHELLGHPVGKIFRYEIRLGGESAVLP